MLTDSRQFVSKSTTAGRHNERLGASELHVTLWYRECFTWQHIVLGYNQRGAVTSLCNNLKHSLILFR